MSFNEICNTKINEGRYIKLLFFLFQYEANKSYCEDLTEGKFSFPIIHAIRSSPHDNQVLSILFRNVTNSADHLRYHFFYQFFIPQLLWRGIKFYHYQSVHPSVILYAEICFCSLNYFCLNQIMTLIHNADNRKTQIKYKFW